MIKFLAGLGVGIALLLVVAGAYFFGRGQFSKTAMESSPAATTVSQALVDSSAAPVSTPASQASEFVNPSATIAAIEEAIPLKKYSELAPYMADSVNVIIYASSCCGAYTKDKTIAQMSYLKDATSPWDFSNTNPNAPKMAAASPYFKDYVIGTSANRYGVGFHLNDKYLIDGVSLVVDYKLLTNP